MADGSDAAVALLSIKPEFVDAILSGQKRVEFRKVGFRRNVSHVIIYASDPVQRVVAYFAVNDLAREHPSVLWREYRHVGGISASAFRDYYQEASQGLAIEVGELRVLRRPVELHRLGLGQRPPQSFRYVGPEVLRDLSALALPRRTRTSPARCSP